MLYLTPTPARLTKSSLFLYSHTHTSGPNILCLTPTATVSYIIFSPCLTYTSGPTLCLTPTPCPYYSRQQHTCSEFRFESCWLHQDKQYVVKLTHHQVQTKALALETWAHIHSSVVTLGIFILFRDFSTLSGIKRD
uniref:Uncharacterized protein n=1 Tax=Cacopsylla melanoneura TaxID=428564 RepID=A0A8D8QD12_9HEMI